MPCGYCALRGLAVYCVADALVSSDNDLLVLNPYQGIPILTPKEFLQVL